MARPGVYPLGDYKEIVIGDGRPCFVPKFRVVTCHRWSVGPGPGIWRRPDGTAAEFTEVHTCGSVWMCPVCAAKITSGRREELMAAIASWQGRGGAVYLVTRTASHEKQASLVEWLKLFAKSLSRAKGTRRALGVAERAGVVGTIRGLEVTHGELNGWHPHTHELVFARPDEGSRLATLRNGWIRELLKRDLAGMKKNMTRAERAAQLRHLRRHALTVQNGDKAAQYVSKFGMEPTTEGGGRWGPGSELTRGHVKQGERFSGRTPFTLLRLYVEGDVRAGHLFREFAVTFQGKSQLYWSPRLRGALAELADETGKQLYFRDGATSEAAAWCARARYIARDLSDEDHAARRGEACSEFVSRLSRDEWRSVLRVNARHDVLIAAQLDGAAGVRELIARLRRERPTDDDAFMADWRDSDRGRPN